MSRAITGGREDAKRRIGKKAKPSAGPRVKKNFIGSKTRVRGTRGVRNVVNRNKGAKPRRKNN